MGDRLKCNRAVNKAKFKSTLPKVKRNEPLISGFGNAGAIFGTQLEETLHPQIIKMARKSGQLNMANKGMSKIPIKVYHLNELDEEERKQMSKDMSMDSNDEKWWEQVDLTRLYLNSNTLTTIDPLISNLGALQLIDAKLSDNRLTSLPSTFGELRCLTKLNLSHNDLATLPEAVCKLDDLKHLTVDHNNLTFLPDDLGSLCILEYLDASHNSLQSLPPGIGYLQRLQKLMLSDNQIEFVPAEIGDMFGLIHLDLTRNKIKELPDCMSNLPKLEELCLRQNYLSTVPKLECPSLKELYLGMNRIKQLNAESLEVLTGLRVFDVSNNGIDVLPDEITLLQNIQRLDITNNYLSNLPAHIGFLSHLKSMPLEGNPLRLIRRDIIQRGTAPLLSFLAAKISEPIKSYPGFADYVAKDIPVNEKPLPDQYQMRTMRTMVYNEKVAQIPDELFENARLAQVRTVDLSHNLLSTVPEKVTELRSHLYDLTLSHNKLTDLNFVHEIKHLQFIDVQNNQLTTLPSEMSDLTELREINLNFNRFDHLPEVLYSLTNLEILFAGENKITAIDPEALSNLTRLATLDLHNNNITFVPPLLGKMTQLRTLMLEGNGFRVPRFDLLAKGTPHVLEYLRSRIVD